MLPLSSEERVCGKGGEFSTDSIGDFNTVFYNIKLLLQILPKIVYCGLVDACHVNHTQFR
jgi:hypothetical protein